MRRPIATAAFILCAAASATAQESGNRVYHPEAANAAVYGNQETTSIGSPTSGDLLLYDPKDYSPSPYVEAYVLVNVKPDYYVAVFAIAQEGATAAESNAKVDKLANDLKSAVGGVGVKAEDTYVDFIAQVPIYDYVVQGRTAKEGQSGFQTKKTVAFRYSDRTIIERMVAAAAGLGVYDLIKVDYVVRDMGAVRQRLFEEAAKVIASKEASQKSLLGLTLRSKAVAEERYATYAPEQLYKTYTAFESASATATRVVDQRKTSTSYYDPLTSATFDAVIDPAGVEPTVQATLFLKVRCLWSE